MPARQSKPKTTDISTTQTFDICSCDLLISYYPGTKRVVSLFLIAKRARSFSFMTEPSDIDIAGLIFTAFT